VSAIRTVGWLKLEIFFHRIHMLKGLSSIELIFSAALSTIACIEQGVMHGCNA